MCNACAIQEMDGYFFHRYLDTKLPFLTTPFYSAACYIVLGQPNEALEEAKMATQLQVTAMAMLQWPE